MPLPAPTNDDNQTPQPRLNGESNIDSILALDEKIRQHEEALTELKRSRNSLLKVHRLPPEVLGNIFHWNVMLKDAFGGLERRSHNFLFVCHHWFEVASQTPELWNFWGDTPRDWERLCRRSGAAPVDLVLYGCSVGGRDFGTTLSDTILRDHANRDAVRRVHLSSEDSDLLNSIISSLTPKREGVRSNRVESIIIRSPPVQVSDFFARYHFPKLRYLELTGCTISSWDHLTSRTSALTNLILAPGESTPVPTISQLLSILASNPTLKYIELSELMVSDDGGGNSSSQVSLPQLEGMTLSGNPQDVFGFLRQLHLPKTVGRLEIFLYDCVVADVSQIIGPYLGYYLRRRGKCQDGIGFAIYAKDDIMLYAGNYVGDTGGVDSAPLEPVHIDDPLRMYLIGGLPKDRLTDAIANLITHIPREEVIYFRSSGHPIPVRIIHAQFPNLKALRFDGVPLTSIIPKPTLGGDEGDLLSFQHLFLHEVTVVGGDWRPLAIFLSRRAATGNPLRTLRIYCSTPVRSELVEGIKGTVRGFSAEHISSLCPFHRLR